MESSSWTPLKSLHFVWEWVTWALLQKVRLILIRLASLIGYDISHFMYHPIKYQWFYQQSWGFRLWFDYVSIYLSHRTCGEVCAQIISQSDSWFSFHNRQADPRCSWRSCCLTWASAVNNKGLGSLAVIIQTLMHISQSLKTRTVVGKVVVRRGPAPPITRTPLHWTLCHRGESCCFA